MRLLLFNKKNFSIKVHIHTAYNTDVDVTNMIYILVMSIKYDMAQNFIKTVSNGKLKQINLHLKTNET